MTESPAIRKVGECPSNLTCRFEPGSTANGETCVAVENAEAILKPLEKECIEHPDRLPRRAGKHLLAASQPGHGLAPFELLPLGIKQILITRDQTAGSAS
jgi:hypothetical protein